MKAIILAGGYGTRLSEETDVKPKPMVEIGGKPILWHVMKIYSACGINEFIICCGYKGYVIKEYFANYFLHMSDITFKMHDNEMEILQHNVEPWQVTLVETGENTMTGGRLKRVASYLDSDPFCFTYGDGIGNVDIKKQINFHNSHGLMATVTGVQPPGRFGAIKFDKNNIVEKFQEKPEGDGSWINGGFFILSPEVINYIEGDDTIWEQQPMMELAKKSQMAVFLHKGFWQPMDTLRDKLHLEKLWDSGDAPWKTW